MKIIEFSKIDFFKFFENHPTVQACHIACCRVLYSLQGHLEPSLTFPVYRPFAIVQNCLRFFLPNIQHNRIILARGNCVNPNSLRAAPAPCTPAQDEVEAADLPGPGAARACGEGGGAGEEGGGAPPPLHRPPGASLGPPLLPRPPSSSTTGRSSAASPCWSVPYQKKKFPKRWSEYLIFLLACLNKEEDRVFRSSL